MDQCPVWGRYSWGLMKHCIRWELPSPMARGRGFDILLNHFLNSHVVNVNYCLNHFLNSHVVSVNCCVVVRCLRCWVSAVCIDCTQHHRRKLSRHRLGSIFSRQVATQHHSLTMRSVWKLWSLWCQKSALIISGPRWETFPGMLSFMC